MDATISLDEILLECEWRAGPYRWPIALMERLRELVVLANREGARTNQSELLAALLLTSPTAGLELKGRIEQYRTATTKDALLSDPPPGQAVSISRPTAGRPARA